MTQTKYCKTGEVIKDARLKKGLSQGQCATHCGVSINAFQMWERGYSKPKDENKTRLCELLNIEIDWSKEDEGE